MFGQAIVPHHVGLAELARAARRQQRLAEAKLRLQSAIDRQRMHEAGRQRWRGAAERAPLRTHQDRLACHQRSRRIAHRPPGNEAAFDHQFGLDAEEGRPPHDDIGHLAVFERADVIGDAEGARGIDGVFGDVAADAGVVAETGPLLRQRAALILHLRRQLPGAADHFVDAAHALAVGAEHRDRADVMKHVFGGNGLRANAAFGKCHVLRESRG